MNRKLKMGLAFLLFYGGFSYALSQPEPSFGNQSYHPPDPSGASGIFVPDERYSGSCNIKQNGRFVGDCQKGKTTVSYHINRGSVNMMPNQWPTRYNPGQPGPEKGPPSSANKYQSPDMRILGGCYLDRWMLRFCKLSSGTKRYFRKVNVNEPSRIDIGGQVLFSNHYVDKLEVCWSHSEKEKEKSAGNSGSISLNKLAKRRHKSPCRNALQEEIKKKKKAGWKCTLNQVPSLPPLEGPQQRGQR